MIRLLTTLSVWKLRSPQAREEIKGETCECSERQGFECCYKQQVHPRIILSPLPGWLPLNVEPTAAPWAESYAASDLARCPSSENQMLFVAKRLDGIEIGGFPRRINAEEQALGRRGQKAEAGPEHRHGRGQRIPDCRIAKVMIAPSSTPRTPPIAVSVMASSVNCSRMSRFAGANRFAHADLAGALGNRNQHDVHDANAADDQGHAGNGKHEDKDRAGDLAPDIGERILGEDGEIIRLVGRHAPAAAQAVRAFRRSALGMSACEVALTLMKCCLSSGCNLRSVASGK